MYKSTQQILITGVYRTGTEYITQLLNNHPDLSSTMYTVNFMRFCYDRYNPIYEKKNYTKLIKETADRIKERWNKKLDSKNIIDYCNTIKKVDYGVLYDLIMHDLFLKNSTVNCWAEKTQLVWTKIPDFLNMFPNGKAIHIMRDPRSVLASFKKYTYAPSPAYLGAIFNCFGSMKLALKYNKKYDNYKFVKYEDVMSSPEKTVIDIFKFLNLSYNHDLLSEDRWVDATGKPWGHNSAFMKNPEKKQKFDKKESVNRWKKNLEDWEIALCEKVCGDLMGKFDYKLSDIKMDWKEYLKPVFTDDNITHFFRLWFVKGEGVEQFPTDPLKPENWTENLIK